MSNPDLPPDSITTLPPEARLYAIRQRYDAMTYSGPTAADRERDTVIGHLLDLIEQRAQQMTNPDFPDLVGMVGAPLIPCKVVEVTATTAPTRRVEGVGDLDATYEQTQRYVIRYQPKPIEITYMAGVSDEEIERAKQAVIESATELLNEQQAPTVEVATSEPDAALYFVCQNRHPLAVRTTTILENGERRGGRHEIVCPACEADGVTDVRLPDLDEGDDDD